MLFSAFTSPRVTQPRHRSRQRSRCTRAKYLAMGLSSLDRSGPNPAVKRFLCLGGRADIVQAKLGTSQEGII